MPWNTNEELRICHTAAFEEKGIDEVGGNEVRGERRIGFHSIGNDLCRKEEKAIGKLRQLHRRQMLR